MKKKIYFAGMNDIKRTKILLENGFKYFMTSYGFNPSRKMINLIKSYKGTEIMLDSGAFSVWKKGIEINIYKYMDFIRNNDINVYFNLDVIGSVEKTKINQKIMEDNGLSPIPVFHYGEPLEYLEWLVERYDYIGLGGTVGKSNKLREVFFDEVYKRYPNNDFHGLGVTSKDLVEKYNWYSVDSTTWLSPFKNKTVIDINGKSRASDIDDAFKRFEISLEYFKFLNNLKREN